MRKYEEGERDYQSGMTQLEAGKSKLVSQMGLLPMKMLWKKSTP